MGRRVGHTGSTPVLDGLTSHLRTAEQNGASASRAAESELIEGHALTTSAGDASTSGLGETQSADGELGDVLETSVIGDSADDDGDLVLLALHVAGHAGDGHRRAVHLGHEQTLQDDGIEVGVGTAGQETVQLDEQFDVHIFRTGGGAADNAVYRYFENRNDGGKDRRMKF